MAKKPAKKFDIDAAAAEAQSLFGDSISPETAKRFELGSMRPGSTEHFGSGMLPESRADVEEKAAVWLGLQNRPRDMVRLREIAEFAKSLKRFDSDSFRLGLLVGAYQAVVGGRKGSRGNSSKADKSRDPIHIEAKRRLDLAVAEKRRTPKLSVMAGKLVDWWETECKKYDATPKKKRQVEKYIRDLFPESHKSK